MTAITDDPLDTICKLLIDQLGVPDAKVTPDARILQDLGIDGDDAWELFEAVHDRFGTDFTELVRQWHVFFSTEGVSPWSMLFIIIYSGSAGVLASVLIDALNWPKIVAWGLVIALFVGGGWSFSRWFGRNPRPLTVIGLAEIVQAGRWPVDPAEVR